MGFLFFGGSMLEKLEKVRQAALDTLEAVRDEDELYQWQVSHLGRKSPVMQIFQSMGEVSAAERPVLGKTANKVKQALEKALETKSASLKEVALKHTLEADRLDVTLPGRPIARGRLHPITQTLRNIYRIFGDMGFQVYRSTDVETDEYNFQLLNFPPHHPAREMQDSFYIETGDRGDNPVILRTHTSPGQIHAMRENSSENPQDPDPIRIILPGMCYRYEQISARSEVQFTQVEGLAVGGQITFSDLKGTLIDFARRMFGESIRYRFRASHFPFTEPSAEMDIECIICGGTGCQVCKQSGWVEILGCGMVHQQLPAQVSLHWYNKQAREGRKLGHLGASAHSHADLRKILAGIRQLLWEPRSPALTFLEEYCEQIPKRAPYQGTPDFDNRQGQRA
jgi:phenylalanyl-tRNA synthetase alpha chain